MKKWLSLLVMITIVLGAAYFAVATESQRKVHVRTTAEMRAALDQIDAMLLSDRDNPGLLVKRAQVLEDLAAAGETLPPSILSTPNDEGKIKALAEDRAQQISNGEYYGMLLERLNNGSVLTPVEKTELLQSGILKGEEDPTYQEIVADLDNTANARFDALRNRLASGHAITTEEKDELLAAGGFEEPRGEFDGLDTYGGPDGFGYRFVDNLNGDTATFAWEDIVGAVGTVALTAINNSDDAVTSVPLSFAFPFYGVNRNTVYPSSNGTVSMTSAQTFTNVCTLPSTTFPSGAIFPLWDDQDTRQGGNGSVGSVSDSGAVYYNDNGSRCIIQWDSVGRHTATADWLTNYTYQVILYADGKIKVQYLALNRLAPSVNYPSPTVGIQQGSTAPNNNFLSYVCNTNPDQSLESLTGRAVWFYSGVPLEANDFVCQSIIAPASPYRVPTGSAFNVIGRFRNAGTVTQATNVGYIFNNGTPVTGTTASLAPNATADIDFAGTATAPATPGLYTLKVYSDLSNDVERRNDTCYVTVQVFSCFDEQKTNAFADTFTTCGALNDFANTCLGTADASEDYIFEWTITQPGAYNILAIGTTTSTRGLLVSSACPPDSFNCLASVNQSQDTLLINCLPLTAGTYYIMVDRSSGCDQVRLYTAPCVDHDYAIESVLQPTPLRVSPSASFNVVGRFRNIGTTTEAADVAYRFNGGAVVTGVTASTAPGLSSDVDFTGTETAPAVVGDYELLIYSNLTTDQNRANDTLRVTVLVRECSDENQTNAFVDVGTTCGAGNEWFNTCVGTADASEDYIYRWTTTTNGAWNVLLTATTSATRGVLISTACPPDSFNCVAFINTSNDSAALSCVPLAAGTYYIMVDRSTGCDAYNLEVSACTDLGRCCYDNNASCATNGAYECQQLAGSWGRGLNCDANPCPVDLDGGETCAEAVALSVPATVRGVTTGGVDDDPGFTCESNFNGDEYVGANTAPDKWYTIVGTGNIIKVSLCNAYTNYDTQILVTCSGDCANFTCVGGNDDPSSLCSYSTVRSIETFCSELGRTYYVVVDGWGTASGAFELAVTDSVPCAVFVDCAPEGRCCYLDNGAAACVDNLAAECSALNGVWTGTTSCAVTPCAIGRCCYLNGGLADCNDLTELECDALNGQWDDLLSCAVDPCPVGRCCYLDGENQLCADNTELECIELAGIWNDALTCAANACPTILQGSDLCEDAVLIPSLNAEYTGTNVGANGEANLPACVNWYGVTGTQPAAVWYKLIGTGNTMTVSLCGDNTDYDSEIGILCGEVCGTEMLCVDSDDDFCESFGASEVSFCTVVGAEYKLIVTTFNTGSTPPAGNFQFIMTDDGVPCTPTVACPVITIPCDPIPNLAAYVVTAANAPEHLQLHFTAPQDADYKVWYTTVPNNDGNPDDGADVNFVLENTILGVTAAQNVVYDSPTGFSPYRYYVVTANCGN